MEIKSKPQHAERGESAKKLTSPNALEIKS